MSLAEAEGLLQHTTVPNLKALEDLWEVNEVLQEANEGASRQHPNVPRGQGETPTHSVRLSTRLLSL